MPQFKHNKKRNTGLVYEFLVRRLSKAMVENDKAAYNKALGIARKYFGEGAILAGEKELFDVIRSTRGVTEGAARRILSEVQTAAKKIDHKKSEIKKSNLIKEINYSFGKDFFSEHRIPDYRILATIHMVLEAGLNATPLTESVQKIQLEESLVAFMTTTDQPTVAPPKEHIDNVVMVMAARRFNEKYSKTLNKEQKVLIEKYIRAAATGDEYPLFQHVVGEIQRISEAMNKAEKTKVIREDKEMHSRLIESRTRFQEIAMAPRTSVSDALVEEIMLFQKLVEEIESDE